MPSIQTTNIATRVQAITKTVTVFMAKKNKKKTFMTNIVSHHTNNTDHYADTAIYRRFATNGKK